MSSNIKHVLVVDDQENWRKAFKLVLENEGFQVSVAKDRQEAEDMLNHFIFDLAVIDVRFKDEERFNVQGLGLFYFIKEKYPLLKTIITTGYPESVPYIPSKVDGFILKVPDGSLFNILEFQKKINKILKN